MTTRCYILKQAWGLLVLLTIMQSALPASRAAIRLSSGRAMSAFCPARRTSQRPKKNANTIPLCHPGAMPAASDASVVWDLFPLHPALSPNKIPAAPVSQPARRLAAHLLTLPAEGHSLRAPPFA